MMNYWNYSRDNDLKSKEYSDITFMVEESISKSAIYGYPILYFCDVKYEYEIEWAYNHREVIVMFIGSDKTKEDIVNKYWDKETRAESASYMEQYFNFDKKDYENDEITTAIQCIFGDMACFREYADETLKELDLECEDN